MKFRITMKDPDGAYESIQEEAKKSLASIEGLNRDERESLMDKRVEMLRDTSDLFMSYGEYLTVEFDTEAKTATVIKER